MGNYTNSNGAGSSGGGGGGGGDTPNLSAVLAVGNSAGNRKITNLLDPTSNQEAATKKYVDDNAGGGGASDLASVLAEGNTTGGTDLEVSTGDELVGQTHLTFNVPTASTYIFKINGSNEMVLNATTLDLQNNALTSTGAGTLNSLTLSSLGAGIAHLNSSGVFSSSTIVNADVSATAAIAGTKVSPNFGSQNLITSGSGTVASLVVSGLVAGIGHLDGSGNLTSSTVVNADVSASAAIAGTKISPDFGSQAVVTTGTLGAGATTASSLRATGLSTGIGHLDGSGNLTSSLLVNADVSGSAAIAGTKVSPDFGSQNVVTTGTLGSGAATVSSLRATGLGAGIGHLDSSGNLTSSTIVNADVNAAAAIAGTKVSPDFGSQNIVTTGSGTVNSLTVSSLSTGIGHYNSSGVLTSSLIVNADVNAAAAIAGTKISPDFGSQNIVTTGSGTVNSLKVSALSTGIGHYDGSGNLTSSLIVNSDVNAAAAIAGTKISPDFGSQNITTTGNETLTGAGNFISVRTNPADAGSIRLATTTAINFRNVANAANIRGVATDASDNLLIGNTSAANLTFDLATAGLYTFNINGGTEATLSATTFDLQNNAITTTGAGTVNSLKVSSLGTGIGHYDSSGNLTSSLIVNADVSASAAIAGSKLGDITGTVGGTSAAILAAANLFGIFGDGSDGNLTAASGTTVLTRDTYYNNVTLSGTAKIDCTGFRLYIKGTLTLSGAAADTITYVTTNGNAGATAGTGGAAVALLQAVGDTLPSPIIASVIGGAGGTGNGSGGGNATNNTAIIGGVGGAGSSGGTGGGNSGGGTGGAGTQTTIGLRLNAINNQFTYQTATNSTILGSFQSSTPGRSGGGGAGDGTAGAGGGSGALGGGTLFLYAANLVTDGSTAAGVISCKGGIGGGGGSATAGNRGGGGAGGGGGGGVLLVVVGTRSGAAVAGGIDASGGVGGVGGNGFGTGVGAAGGTGGFGGKLSYWNLGAGTNSFTDAGTAGSAGNAASGVTGGAGGAGGVSIATL